MRFSKRMKLGLAAGVALTFGAVNAAPSYAVHQTVTGLNENDQIVQFAVGTPGTLTSGPSAITFAPATVTDTDLIGIDYRPRGGNLFAQASQGTIFVLDPPAVAGGNWTATRVSTPNLDPFAGTPTTFGFDFNPVPDRIRTVNDDNANDNNFRFNPNNGQQVDTDTATPGVQADGDLAFAGADTNAGDAPVVGGAAYTNNFDGATTTTLYDIETGNDVLTTQNPPNSGTLNTVGPLGVPTTELVGFDIETETGTAYAALQPAPGTQSRFYRLNLMTGAATEIGPIGPAGSAPLVGVSLIPVPVARFTQAVTSVSENGGQATITVVRDGPTNQAATVNYATEVAAGDTATSGSDFTPTSGTLTFAPGEQQQSFTVPILDNDENNAGADETFTVRLSMPSRSLNLQSPPTAQVQIDDDEANPGPLVALVSVRSDSRLKKVLSEGVLKYRYSCNKACSETSSFQLRDGTVLGTNSSSLEDDGVNNQEIALSQDAKKTLRKAGNKKRVKVQLVTTFTDDDPGTDPYTETETVLFKLYR